MPPELGASTLSGGEESAETLSKERDRRSGDVDCCACRKEFRESGGRLEGVRDDGGERAKSSTLVSGGG